MNKGAVNYGMSHLCGGLLMLFFFSSGGLLSCPYLYDTNRPLGCDRIEIVLLNPHNNNPTTLVSELRFFSEDQSAPTMRKTKDLNVGPTPHSQPSLLDLCWDGAAVGCPFYLI